jgi:hypothetical protein
MLLDTVAHHTNLFISIVAHPEISLSCLARLMPSSGFRLWQEVP